MRGIPAVAIMTDRFEPSARAVAELNGLPDYPFAVIGHPIANDSDAALCLAEAAVQRIVPLFTNATVASAVPGHAPQKIIDGARDPTFDVGELITRPHSPAGAAQSGRQIDRCCRHNNLGWSRRSSRPTSKLPRKPIAGSIGPRCDTA
jgi:hypothetical protein